MVSLNQRTATELAQLIASKRASSVEIVQACLDRIAARDSDVQAWVHVDRERVLAQARACDRTASRGPLHGIPFGVKDIIDTHDMPSEYGSSIYAGHRPR